MEKDTKQPLPKNVIDSADYHTKHQLGCFGIVLLVVAFVIAIIAIAMQGYIKVLPLAIVPILLGGYACKVVLRKGKK